MNLEVGGWLWKSRTTICQLVQHVRATENAQSRISRMVECKHGVNKERCTDCRNPPPGINSTVYVTNGGAAYHNMKSCSALADGQLYAERVGMEVHPIVAVKWGHIAPDRPGCLICCPQNSPAKVQNSNQARRESAVGANSMDWELKKLRHGGKCLSCDQLIERYEFGWHNAQLKAVRCSKCGVSTLKR